MPIPSAGEITLSDNSVESVPGIQTEFGGENPASLSEYYAGGTYVPAGTSGTYGVVPSAGSPISFRSFYGTQFKFVIDLGSSNHFENFDVAAYALSRNDPWDGIVPIILNVGANVWLWSDTPNTAGLIISSTVQVLTVNNSGNIIGCGGSGGDATYASGSAIDGQDGGSAISNASSETVTIINALGAYVAGGGGGGGAYWHSSNASAGIGGGSGAGRGDWRVSVTTSPGSAAADYTYSRGDLGTKSYAGAQAGARGGAVPNPLGTTVFPVALPPKIVTPTPSGRMLPGTTAAGDTFTWAQSGATPSTATYTTSSGGAGGVAGTSSLGYASGGGGGWGAAGGSVVSGGSAGAAGAAISGSAVTLTNNGTIYGTTST